MKYRIHFVITNLETDGAQMMLHKLVSNIDRSAFIPEIISLTDFVPLAEKFREMDVPVRTLGMSRGIPDPRGIFRLAEVFRPLRPHLVQTWMYHSDLIGGLAAKMVGDIPVIWNIRHSNLGPRSSKKMTRITAKICAGLSSTLPKKIICCAEKAKQVHVDLGYDSSRIHVIPNGFDMEVFKPNQEARQKICMELSIPLRSTIIGLIARFHPEKDHQTFVQAAALLSAKTPNVHFILCGDRITWENRELRAWIEAAEMRKAFHLLGQRSDIPRLSASFDIASSSSISEGFSNTIGEAMACGVPCVVTDVGDSALIVGDTGETVPSRNPEDLSNAWTKLINMGEEGRRNLGYSARQRIFKLFSLNAIVNQYEDLYKDILTSSTE